MKEPSDANPYEPSVAGPTKPPAESPPFGDQLDQADFGRAQRRMLMATMFCYFFYYTGRQTFGFAIPGIQEDLGISKATLGWVSACFLWSYAFGQAVNGNLGDKFGGRRLMSFGAVLSCFFNWVTSFGFSRFTLFVPWGLNGFAQSMGWAPGAKVLSNWWGHEHRGKVFGFYVFAAGMSSVLAYTTSLVVIDVLDLSWRWIIRLPVLLMLVGGIVYYLIVRDRPEDLGFKSPHDTGDDSPADNPSETESSWERYKGVLSNGRFMIASLAIGFQSAARYGLIFWVPVHFLGEDWKNAGGAKWISLALPIGMALGALVSGWLSDRVFHSKRWPLICMFMAIAGAASMAIYFTPRENHVLGLVFLFLAGFFVYGPQSAFWALCPDILGPERAGTGTGIMNFHAYLFAGLGEPLIGWVIENNKILSNGIEVDNTGLVFPIVAACCVASAIIGLFIRR